MPKAAESRTTTPSHPATPYPSGQKLTVEEIGDLASRLAREGESADCRLAAKVLLHLSGYFLATLMMAGAVDATLDLGEGR